MIPVDVQIAWSKGKVKLLVQMYSAQNLLTLLLKGTSIKFIFFEKRWHNTLHLSVGQSVDRM